jgi:hypothetical protein
MKPKRMFSPEEQADIKSLYLSMKSTIYIGNKYKCVPSVINRALRDMGVKIRKKCRTQRIDPSEYQRIYEMRLSGMTFDSIGAEYDSCASAIRSIIVRYEEKGWEKDFIENNKKGVWLL